MRKVLEIHMVGELSEENGHIFQKCPGCRMVKPIEEFGFRQMKPQDDTWLQNQSRCTECRHNYR